MVKKKARLGRGLGALLGDVKTTTQIDLPADPRSESAQLQTAYREIPIEQLQRGKYQPRIDINKQALAELGESIKSQGVIQPLLVRPVTKHQFEIIAGERRWRGAQIAGLKTVPAVIREIPDQTAMAVALIENMQRENLNAIEQAKGFQRLLEEFGLTHQEVSEAVGYSRTTVSNLLRMLTLHPSVQEMVQNKVLDMGHARTLLGLPQARQPEAANVVKNKSLSVRQTERLVKKWLNDENATQNDDHNGSKGNADIIHLQDDLSERLGATVHIRHGVKKGKLIIHYHSLDELDGILERIK